MLFDLRSGKRRRAVQIVYSLLALSFLIGFVGFGVGTGGGLGGIFDALGLSGGSSSSSSSSAFDSQIEQARARLAKDPKDPSALARLARYEYLKGRAELGQDSSGNPVLTGPAQTDLGAAADTWERYLKVAGKRPSIGTARQVVTAYVLLGDWTGAARTQRLIAAAQGDASSYATLATYLYRGEQFGAGDAAAKRALAEASGSQRKSYEQQLTAEKATDLYAAGKLSAGDAAVKRLIALVPKAQRKQIQQQAAALRKQAQALLAQRKAQQQAQSVGAAPNPLQNPFGGLGAPPSP